MTIFITEAPDGTVVISHQAPKEADDTLAGLLAVQLLNGAKQILDTICDQETQVQKVS